MKKLMIMFLGVAILISILISGCKGGSHQQVGNMFIGGDVGLAESFIEGLPPNEIFDAGQMPFSVGIQINNEGEFDFVANQGYVRLKGFSPQQLGLNDESDMKKLISQDLQGTKRIGDEIFPGGSTQVTFDNLRFMPDLQAGTDVRTFYIDSCYRYGSKAVAKLCLRGNNFQPGAQEICEVTGLKSVETSGAPVKVVSVSESPSGQSSVQVTLKIKNIGNGIVFSKDFDLQNNNCEDIYANYEFKNKVYVTVSTDGDEEISCPQLNGGTEGFITLIPTSPNAPPEGSLYCTITAQGTGTFEAYMYINLVYNYDQEITKDVTIRDISGSQNNNPSGNGNTGNGNSQGQGTSQ